MKRFELFFTVLRLPLDYVLIVLAGFTAYNLRFAKFITDIRPIQFNLPWEKYWPVVLVVAAFWLIIFAFSGLYSTNPNRKLSNELNRLFYACSTGFAAITIYVFFTLQKFDSRFLVLAGWILAVLYVGAGRIAVRLLKFIFYRLGFGLRQTIIIGNQAIAEKIIKTLNDRPALGYRIQSVYEHFDTKTASQMIEHRPDEIIFTDPKANEDEALQAVDFAGEHHIVFKYSADLFSTISSNMAVSTIAGIPIIELRKTRLTAWGKIIKRFTDILGSLILIIIFSPIFLFAALIILLESGRPIIYLNERVGKEGKKFWTYKFRSMHQKYCTGKQFAHQNIEALKQEEQLIATQNIKNGPVYKIKNDPRVTPFGRFIRRFSIDELPQFFNVLKGEMSLIGPRPHQPREVAKYEKWHKTVLNIKPGITGLAQISGRSDLNFDEEVKLDTFYIEHWSFFLDLVILIKTPFVIIKSKGAW